MKRRYSQIICMVIFLITRYSSFGISQTKDVPMSVEVCCPDSEDIKRWHKWEHISYQEMFDLRKDIVSGVDTNSFETLLNFALVPDSVLAREATILYSIFQLIESEFVSGDPTILYLHIPWELLGGVSDLSHVLKVHVDLEPFKELVVTGLKECAERCDDEKARRNSNYWLARYYLFGYVYMQKVKNPHLDKRKGIEALKRSGRTDLLEKWHLTADTCVLEDTVVLFRETNDKVDSAYGRWIKHSLVGAPMPIK